MTRESVLPEPIPQTEPPSRAKAATRVGRDAGVLMAGDILDRGLGFAFLLVATKLFGLEIYGAYLIALSVFQVVRTIVSFGLSRSIVKDAAAADAVDDLARLKGAKADELYESALAKEEDPLVLAELIRLRAKWGGAGAFDLLAKRLDDPAWPVRAALMRR